MTITEKTTIAEYQRMYSIVELAGVDIMKECERFDMPTELAETKLRDFNTISFFELKQLWSTKDKEELLKLLIDIMVYPNVSKLRRKIYPTSEKLMLKMSVIDFYKCLGVWTKDIENSAEQFSKMRIELSDEEKQAGFDEADPMAIEKMILSFAQKMGISDLDVAANTAWTVYLFVFRTEYEQAKKQRLLNEIISKKHETR